MPEPLKNYFNQSFVQNLAQEIHKVHSKFDRAEFENAVLNSEWENRELKDSMRHISTSLGVYLPQYTEAVQVLMKAADKFGDFMAMVFPDFVEVFGQDDPELSLDALEWFTQFSSSEFAIRPFIIKYENMTMDRMLVWSKSANHHIRRLSSEGCRPRLPWAIALPDFKKDPTQILPILENLKNDDSEYVRKSVANNINDITKDNPDVALSLAKSWHGQSEKTDWILKHGLRTLLKKGNDEALRIFGFKEKVNAEVKNLKLSKSKVKIGDQLEFRFDIKNNDQDISLFKIGFKVGYIKSTGKVSEKIFHMSEKEFSASQIVSFNKKLSFQDLSTRKHYPGRHHIAIIINGQEYDRRSFELTPD